MAHSYTPTLHEIEVLRMANGERDWERGAWVNACVEFLQEGEFLTRRAEITQKGKDFLNSL